jgi:hypothetical protein
VAPGLGNVENLCYAMLRVVEDSMCILVVISCVRNLAVSFVFHRTNVYTSCILFYSICAFQGWFK